MAGCWSSAVFPFNWSICRPFTPGGPCRLLYAWAVLLADMPELAEADHLLWLLAWEEEH